MNHYLRYKDNPPSVGNVLYHLNRVFPLHVVEIVTVGNGRITLSGELLATYEFCEFLDGHPLFSFREDHEAISPAIKYDMLTVNNMIIKGKKYKFTEEEINETHSKESE